VGGGSNAAGTYYHYLDNEEVNIIAVEAAGLGVDSERCYLRARGRCYSWRQDPIDAIYGWANYRTIFYFGRIRLPGVGPTPIFTQQEEHSLSQLQTNKRCSGD
jgi:hypothetical protein